MNFPAGLSDSSQSTAAIQVALVDTVWMSVLTWKGLGKSGYCMKKCPNLPDGRNIVNLRVWRNEEVKLIWVFFCLCFLPYTFWLLYIQKTKAILIFLYQKTIYPSFLNWIMLSQWRLLVYPWSLLSYFDSFEKNIQGCNRINSLCIVPYFIDIVGQVPRELKLLHRGRKLVFARANDQQWIFFLMFSANIHSTIVLNQCSMFTLRRL